MNLNTGKCHLVKNLIYSKWVISTKISLSEKILGITFDCKLKFKKDIEDICHLQDLHHNWEQLKNVFL